MCVCVCIYIVFNETISLRVIMLLPRVIDHWQNSSARHGKPPFKFLIKGVGEPPQTI